MAQLVKVPFIVFRLARLISTGQISHLHMAYSEHSFFLRSFFLRSFYLEICILEQLWPSEISWYFTYCHLNWIAIRPRSRQTYLLQDDLQFRRSIKVYITNCVNIKSRQVPIFLYWPVENVQFCINSIGHFGWISWVSSRELWKCGRFPFYQIFRFEIPGIPCDEWNIIFRLVGPSRPRPSRFKFRTKIRNKQRGNK